MITGFQQHGRGARFVQCGWWRRICCCYSCRRGSSSFVAQTALVTVEFPNRLVRWPIVRVPFHHSSSIRSDEKYHGAATRGGRRLRRGRDGVHQRIRRHHAGHLAGGGARNQWLLRMLLLLRRRR